ncbi:MAG: amidohydrolase family protein [Steroidobacteraceae bacterium]|jgi:N-acyl-D-amino-acid deacylase|nr:amidohydrolase family protein [Steroidobacteraceae bacterium]
MNWLRRTRQLFWGAVFSAVWRRAHEGAGGNPFAFNLLLRRGLVYDGQGGPPFLADVGIVRDRVVAIGDLSQLRGRQEIDASGLAVAPGFINMLSWATESLILDPSSESDLRQGVTLEVFGEGVSMGPLNPTMRAELQRRQGERRFEVEWTTLGEYLEFLEKRGVSTNVASFVGATSLRIHELGHAARAPTPRELARMCELVRQAMREGALGVGSALIYAPAVFAGPPELEALACAAAEHGGGYISHLRSESTRLLEAVDELIGIARRTRQHAEIYHLKAAGAQAWPLMEQAIARIEAARAEGLDVSANMYPYLAGASGLDAAMPPWVQEGGHLAWLARLRDPAVRREVLAQIAQPSPEWESLYAAAGSAENVRLLGFHEPALQAYTGLTLGEVARRRGQTPEETMVDLVLEDNSRVNVAYFMMDEAVVRRQLALPWVSLCSDEESLAPRGAFLHQAPHPRAYGAFARFLGHYVRDQKLVGLAEAIRRLTSLPAHNLRLRERGAIRAGWFADLVLFDPARIADRATYADPHQFAVGVEHVIVNGQLVLRDGRLTGARPGRVVRGPGWRGHAAQPAADSLSLPRAAG